MDVTWSCGSAQHFQEFPNESVVAGLPVSVDWEGATQAVVEGEECQYIHAIGVYSIELSCQIARIRDGRAKRLSKFVREGVVKFCDGQVHQSGVSRIRHGDLAGRIEGFKISGKVFSTLSPGTSEFEEMLLACGPSRAWR